MTAETNPSAAGLAWAQRLVRFNTVSRESNLPLIECIADHLRTLGVPLRLSAICRHAQPVAGAAQTLADTAGHCHRRYGVPDTGATYLLRPDQHICARWLQPGSAQVQAAVHRVLGA